MKKITVSYLPGLGDFLDSNNFEWFNNGNNTITISNNTDIVLYKVFDRRNEDINLCIGTIEDCNKYRSENKSPYYLTQRVFR